MAALDQAVSSGRARYVGVSNYAGWQLAQAATWQRAVPTRVPLACTQEEYSLLNREVEREVIPAAAASGLGLLAYSPLALIVLREAPTAEQGRASSAISLTDSLGTALGTGITGALVAASVRATDAPAMGLAAGFAVAVGVALVGVALSGRLHAQMAAEPVGKVAVARGA